MKKKAAVRERRQGKVVAMSMAMQQLMLPLVLAMDATKNGLLAFVQQMGMVLLQELLATEAAMIAGPKGKHAPGPSALTKNQPLLLSRNRPVLDGGSEAGCGREREARG